MAKTSWTYNARQKLTSFLPNTAGQDDKSLDRLKRDDRDVICIAWLLQCEREGRLVPLRPRYYLHMSRASLVGGLLRGNSNRKVAGQGRAEQRWQGMLTRPACRVLLGAWHLDRATSCSTAGQQPRRGQHGRLVHERCAPGLLAPGTLLGSLQPGPPPSVLRCIILHASLARPRSLSCRCGGG